MSAEGSGSGRAKEDKPSREAVKADREAAKEAKRAAKAAAAAKKAGGAKAPPPAAGGATGGAAAPAARGERTAERGAAPSRQSQPRQEGDGQSPSQGRSSARQEHARGQGHAQAAQRGEEPKTAANKAANAAATTTPATPSVLGGISLFGNVSTSKSSAQLAPYVTAATHRAQVHPSVLKLAQQLSSFSIVGADARAIAVLGALRDFVADYRTPQGAVLNRDLVTKLNPQITFLVTARPLGASVGHAIRFLKYEISVVPVELSEQEAKETILSRVDHFVRDRITYATRVIASNLSTGKIKDGDVVLTFARSSVVEQTLLEAWQKRGKRFHVVVVDARPLCEGRKLLTNLVDAGIPCTYGLLTSLSSLVAKASIVLLGTASLLANGALYARAGTASCAMMARAQGVPVIVCCETYKFSERIQLDSFVVNEAGDPRDILAQQQDTDLISAKEWEGNESLGAVNLLYDLTPPRYVTAVASEVGLSGPESVGVILRDYKSVLYGQ
ncbi:IF-2B-domain-containing protein [Acaromyces ingoldii]|uniref:Translation initiation factor eIF2B subunit delta n=1 Tax=Acaromyces ingoldii TaxID=215250 RepID=A0A316YQZ3_9BASI|nr:IF-2B-domain-containing protein [Acaromyces ingoldii]PWN90185.1 IF-2B-domain-containing protein [Acaromyces ingoldii]